ncbi:uncharacterized protein TRIADDRAFT_52705 [Trichoplax adhaerens]|uniref:Calcium release-activated calcium channel protein 1 n=1 Tax=Trichoplax adhaerens TaxID=10228 RepID=B3RJW9_TRIAD|nr:hypothetical protein TRIADDRAFT_52705 [Trichoplax adhaerens]EDV29134.1 hypothetical protein TRIADDRAFT_52705 [Trichoplax adhaerens]|eukprot:XP_002108336.1 hypothetical protein TRIADDRAFT_52705 [Trichoplax adhaerens]
MVEIDIAPVQSTNNIIGSNTTTNCPPGHKCVPLYLLVCFAVLTTILISVHLFAVMISTCILPHIDAAESEGPSDGMESPHFELHKYIELAWGFSTVVGIFLFLCEIIVLCWVKFITIDEYAALAGTCTMIPVLVVFTVFACHFYRRLSRHEYRRHSRQINELKRMAHANLKGSGFNAGENTV